MGGGHAGLWSAFGSCILPVVPRASKEQVRSAWETHCFNFQAEIQELFCSWGGGTVLVGPSKGGSGVETVPVLKDGMAPCPGVSHMAWRQVSSSEM